MNVNVNKFELIVEIAISPKYLRSFDVIYYTYDCIKFSRSMAFRFSNSMQFFESFVLNVAKIMLIEVAHVANIFTFLV